MTTKLTPAMIADLRASIRTRTTTPPPTEPYIVWGASDSTFYLHAGGRVMAAHPDPRVLGAMLVAERAERGFIATVLDSTHPVDEALLDPAGRKRALAERNAAENTRREAEAREAERRRNLMRNVDPSTVTLDDVI